MFGESDFYSAFKTVVATIYNWSMELLPGFKYKTKCSDHIYYNFSYQ